MSLRPSPYCAAASWIINSELPWQRVLTFGPAAFDSHARLRFILDPTRAGQDETDGAVATGGLSETEQLNIVVSTLLSYTTTPQELFFAFWDGHGFAMPGARFETPHREFFLYHGSVSENGSWDIATEDQAPGQPWLPEPAYIWPADQAWCVANDVDPHWAGIGAGAEAIEALCADERLDVIPADPAQPQPFYT